jgi:hypothetical protein
MKTKEKVIIIVDEKYMEHIVLECEQENERIHWTIEHYVDNRPNPTGF